ncbi:MAG: hypothetical protein A2293_09945 [Elusimicrobia bacterium RIFOXYB2_FULL_49_7]|nr:MAG: hypothetical protein A2293_09945 [Elusimicrobia bacterium RIFOXYB2_FULL_49_7]
MKGRESGMPELDYWQTFFDAQSILRSLVRLDKPSKILEFGSGYGTFTLPLVHAGHSVIGLDIEEDLVSNLQLKADTEGFKNLKVQVRDFIADGTGEEDGSIDHVLLYNILHIEEPIVILKETLRILKNGGSASIIHWRKDIPTPRGPSLEIRPSAEQCKYWALKAGFNKTEDILLGNSAPYHYGIILYKI